MKETYSRLISSALSSVRCLIDAKINSDKTTTKKVEDVTEIITSVIPDKYTWKKLFSSKFALIRKTVYDLVQRFCLKMENTQIPCTEEELLRPKSFQNDFEYSFSSLLTFYNYFHSFYS